MATISAERRQEQVPDDVYIQFVRSLFDNARILLIGGACYALIATMVYFETGNALYIGFACLLLAVNVWRYSGIRGFHAAGGIIKSREHAERWEHAYIIRGLAQGVSLGVFSFVSIYLFPNPYSEVASVALAVSTLLTVVSRNYGSARMVRIFSVLLIGPIALALILRMTPANIALGLLVFPLTYITINSTAHLRNVLFAAVTGHKKARELALRFDRALNTMPEGLLMLDESGEVIVANAEAAVLLNMPGKEAMLGLTVSSLLQRIVAAGLLDREQYRYATQQLTGAMRQRTDRKLIIHLKDGRSFEVSAREGDEKIGVVIFEDITTRVRAEKRITTMARYDSLTSLPNRAYFHELVSEQLSRGDPNRNCALAMFDLDDFKGVNDSLGHPAGDELIRQIAARLAPFASQTCIVSRFGGDEFAIYCDELRNLRVLGRLLDDIASKASGLYEIAGSSVRVQLSGGATFMPVREAEIDSLTVKADLALYKAKERDKNGWCLFEGEMEEAFLRKQMLKADLRAAVDAKSLRIVFQPIVSITTMTIASCEALCRWDHPELGPISPAIFIPLAEETGIISDLTTLVLNTACVECAKWPASISVSVNLSAKDFRDTSIIDKVGAALGNAGLAPNRLEIEVTETSLLDDKSETRRLVEELRRMGVQIALDDFGTGYSSLSYLHRLPLDKIKIDRSFLVDLVEDKRSLHLLAGIVQLSHQLGLSVTIEGVETFEQLKMISAEVKPDHVQGFLFGSALTASGIEAMSRRPSRLLGSERPDVATVRRGS